jgi:protein KRI1
MRRVDDKRKEARKEAKARKEEEKLKRKEEINKLKALKREEIMEKLKKAEFLAGKNAGIFQDKKLLEKAEKEL